LAQALYAVKLAVFLLASERVFLNLDGLPAHLRQSLASVDMMERVAANALEGNWEIGL
jgi:hypothetical protein